MTFSQSYAIEQEIKDRSRSSHGWVELQIMSFLALEVGEGIIRRERNNVNSMDCEALGLVVEVCNCSFGWERPLGRCSLFVGKLYGGHVLCTRVRFRKRDVGHSPEKTGHGFQTRKE